MTELLDVRLDIKLLGHATVKSTARYAHLDDAHLSDAVDKIGEIIVTLLN